jgi:hypothetical protein
MARTTTAFQVVVDARDPHAQARFWAQALGYDIEDTTALISGLRDAGVVTEGTDFFEANGELWWSDLVGIRDPDGRQPRLLFQRADTPKPSTRNRLHLDLNVGPDRRADEVVRLEHLGATVLYEIDEPGGRHTTMADPEGNELCVQ